MDPAEPRPPSRATASTRSAAGRAAGLLAGAGLLAAARPALAVTAERAAALAEGEGDAGRFLSWLTAVAGGLAAAAVVAAVAAARRARRDARTAGAGGPPGAEPSAAAVLLTSAAVVLGSLAAAGLVAAALGGRSGLKPVSSEGGPLEAGQMVLWVAAAIAALASTGFLRDREARGGLLLLGAGALLAAAREADLHEKLNPKSLGPWGVRFRGDWWVSAASPVGPRVLWAVVFVAVVAAAVYLVRRGGPALLVRGRRHRRLLPLLAAVAGLMFLGFGLDDLLRYRPGVNLRQSQLAEETIELAAGVVYLGCVAWAVRLGRPATGRRAGSPDRAAP